MDDLAVKNPEIGPDRDIRIGISVVPGELHSASAVKTENEEFPGNHVGGPGLKKQIVFLSGVIHISREKEVGPYLMLVADAEGMDEKQGHVQIIIRGTIILGARFCTGDT
jgi:hypothetical protein